MNGDVIAVMNGLDDFLLFWLVLAGLIHVDSHINVV